MSEHEPRRADPTRLEGLAAQLFQHAGIPPRDAERAAAILIDADLRGIESHGVMNLPSYLDDLAAGRTNPRPNIAMKAGSPTTVSLDGDRGLGLLVGYRAMSECIRMAKEVGTGWATVCNSTHSGAGTYYVVMAARQGMVGLHVSTGGSTVAAPGGTRRLLGNNVFAFAAPGQEHGPLVLDMAPTMAIANKIKKLEWDRKPMPEGWAVDRNGRFITDPATYFATEGAILPLGGTPANGVHKGFGLLLLVDILAGALSGDGGSMLRRKGEHCHAFCALRIDAFPTGGDFGHLVDAMVEKLHTTPTAPGASRVRYPGERGNQASKDRRAQGIPLRAEVIAALETAAAAAKIETAGLWV